MSPQENSFLGNVSTKSDQTQRAVNDETFYFLQHFWLISDAVRQSINPVLQPSRQLCLKLPSVRLRGVSYILSMRPRSRVALLISLRSEHMFSGNNTQGFKIPRVFFNMLAIASVFQLKKSKERMNKGIVRAAQTLIPWVRSLN